MTKLANKPIHFEVSALLASALLLSAPALSDEQLVAQAFSKAAVYILNTDFLSPTVEDAFSKDELDVLFAHRKELDSVIQGAFHGSHSIGAALLTAHFKLEENIPLLRAQLFRPGTGYGWEGPDYLSEEDYLTDNQFVYQSVYLTAIEATAGRPIDQVIRPTPQEEEQLWRHMENPSYPNYHWANWLARKLKILATVQ